MHVDSYRYRNGLALISLAFIGALAGCGNRMAGEYIPQVYVVEGKVETGAPGYSRAEVEQRLRDDGRALSLNGDGTYTMRFRSTGNEGRWRREGDTLYLRDTVSQGNAIVPALQSDRAYRVRTDGGITDEGTYSAYNLVVVYERK